MNQYRSFSSPKEVEAWISRTYSKLELQDLTRESNPDSPLFDYKGNAYKVINTMLRNGSMQSQDYDISGLQTLLKSKTIPENIQVYRYVDLRELLTLHWHTVCGKEYLYPSFLSTTLLKDFYSMDNIKRCKFAIMLLVMKGSHGTYIPEINPDLPEYEILLPYHIKLKRLHWNLFLVDGR